MDIDIAASEVEKN